MSGTPAFLILTMSNCIYACVHVHRNNTVPDRVVQRTFHRSAAHHKLLAAPILEEVFHV